MINTINPTFNLTLLIIAGIMLLESSCLNNYPVIHDISHNDEMKWNYEVNELLGFCRQKNMSTFHTNVLISQWADNDKKRSLLHKLGMIGY